MFTRYALKLSMLRTFFFPRAIDQPMSRSKFSCDPQNHLSCILSFPYHPSHHLHLLPSFTSRLSASIMLIAQIFNHPTWTPTWLPPSAEPKQFIIFTFPVQKCKVHSLWNYRGVEHFFLYLMFLLLLLWFMDNLSLGFQRDGKLSGIKWKCKQNKNLRLHTTSK